MGLQSVLYMAIISVNINDKMNANNPWRILSPVSGRFLPHASKEDKSCDIFLLNCTFNVLFEQILFPTSTFNNAYLLIIPFAWWTELKFPVTFWLTP
jgi:hypothetical protein